MAFPDRRAADVLLTILLFAASPEVVTNIPCLPVWEFMRKTEPGTAEPYATRLYDGV